ncbi:LOW QUALITY PROTEIN: hypothetical protein V2J09_021430 [Rumex salicifolius]
MALDTFCSMIVFTSFAFNVVWNLVSKCNLHKKNNNSTGSQSIPEEPEISANLMSEAPKTHRDSNGIWMLLARRTYRVKVNGKSMVVATPKEASGNRFQALQDELEETAIEQTNVVHGKRKSKVTP